ncbi:MAG: ion transporter [Ignavibacteria bacterium]|nr:ion transporter [Ignavibacteria bacterium]
MKFIRLLINFYRLDFRRKISLDSEYKATDKKPLIVRIADSRLFHDAVIVVIIASAILIGLETSQELYGSYRTLFYDLDQAILAFFVVELVIRIVAEAMKTDENGSRIWYRFFLDPWHNFDFVIVFVCLLPVHATFFAVLRTARILRVLLLIDELPRLKLLVGALLKSLPSMAYVLLLLLLHFYSYAIIGTDLFGRHNPEKFGNLATAMLSLFQVVTGDDWTSIMKNEMMNASGYEQFGIAIYFVSFIILGAMIFLNLFIGVITSEIADLKAQDDKKKMLIKCAVDNNTLDYAVEQVELQMREMQEALVALKAAARTIERKSYHKL